MKSLILKLVIIISLSVICFIDIAYAAPGGRIASAIFESFWGKIFLGALTIIFLPLILYTVFKEHFAEKRVRKDLFFLAQHDALFNWQRTFERVKDCFYRIHSSWENEDLSEVSQWMTDWYWQNQQLVHLNRWKQKGLINVCHIKKVVNMKPIMFSHANYGGEHEGSSLAILVTANMQDYLQERASKKIVEGSKKYKEVDSVWVFTVVNGQWVVSDIEDGSMSLVYAKMMNGMPKVETTLLNKVGV